MVMRFNMNKEDYIKLVNEKMGGNKKTTKTNRKVL